MEEKKSDDFSPIGERGPKVVTAVPVVPHKGFGRSEVVPKKAEVVPPKPWHEAALRIHREEPQKAAFTVALELSPLGYRNIQGRQVAELWKQVDDPEITPLP